jgi:hypothetical protein
MDKKLTPKEQEVLKYMVKVESMNFAKSGKFGIYPNTKQVEMVFGFSRQRANAIINRLQDHLQKNLRQIN